MLTAVPNYLESPNAWVVAWTVLVAFGLVGVVVTAMKGRTGWAVIGLLTGGLLGLFTAFLSATARSPWTRMGKTRRRASGLGER